MPSAKPPVEEELGMVGADKADVADFDRAARVDDRDRKDPQARRPRESAIEQRPAQASGGAAPLGSARLQMDDRLPDNAADTAGASRTAAGRHQPGCRCECRTRPGRGAPGAALPAGSVKAGRLMSDLVFGPSSLTEPESPPGPGPRTAPPREIRPPAHHARRPLATAPDRCPGSRRPDPASGPGRAASA